MREAELFTLLELRLLVGYLGEKEQHGWWSSSFFSAIAASFLEPVFTRTARLAQYNGVLEAGRRVHDASVGVGHAFHLFRLPQEVEQDLHRRAAESLTAEHPVIAAIQYKETAVARLGSLAGDGTVHAEGPISIGSISDLMKPSTAKRLAAHYSEAFASNKRVYPYFTN